MLLEAEGIFRLQENKERLKPRDKSTKEGSCLLNDQDICDISHLVQVGRMFPLSFSPFTSGRQVSQGLSEDAPTEREVFLFRLFSADKSWNFEENIYESLEHMKAFILSSPIFSKCNLKFPLHQLNCHVGRKVPFTKKHREA